MEFLKNYSRQEINFAKRVKQNPFRFSLEELIKNRSQLVIDAFIQNISITSIAGCDFEVMHIVTKVDDPDLKLSIANMRGYLSFNRSDLTENYIHFFYHSGNLNVLHYLLNEILIPFKENKLDIKEVNRYLSKIVYYSILGISMRYKYLARTHEIPFDLKKGDIDLSLQGDSAISVNMSLIFPIIDVNREREEISLENKTNEVRLATRIIYEISSILLKCLRRDEDLDESILFFLVYMDFDRFKAQIIERMKDWSIHFKYVFCHMNMYHDIGEEMELIGLKHIKDIPKHLLEKMIAEIFSQKRYSEFKEWISAYRDVYPNIKFGLKMEKSLRDSD